MARQDIPQIEKNASEAKVEAGKELEGAKKALEEAAKQAAEAAKNPDAQIAKEQLKKAAEALKEAAQAVEQAAQKANEQAQPDVNKEAGLKEQAPKQGEVKDETQKAQQAANDLAPEAAETLGQAGRQMDKSKEKLEEGKNAPDEQQAAIDAGKHILSQKPFVVDLDVGEELVAQAEARGVKLAVNQNGRWAPHFSYMRQAVAARKLDPWNIIISGDSYSQYLKDLNQLGENFDSYKIILFEED